MGRQLTRHRLAEGFPAPARVAAKSGGLVGICRNEVGMIDYPDGRPYLAAVFTATASTANKDAHGSDAEINRMIGRVAATAVNQLVGASAGQGRL